MCAKPSSPFLWGCSDYTYTHSLVKVTFSLNNDLQAASRIPYFFVSSAIWRTIWRYVLPERLTMFSWTQKISRTNCPADFLSVWQLLSLGRCRYLADRYFTVGSSRMRASSVGVPSTNLATTLTLVQPSRSTGPRLMTNVSVPARATSIV